MEVLNVNEVKEFSKEKRIREKLLGSEQQAQSLYAMSPGQSTPRNIRILNKMNYFMLSRAEEYLSLIIKKYL